MESNIRRSIATTNTEENIWLKDLIRNYNLYLMILPAFILFVVFYYLPMYGIIIAFKEYDMVDGIVASQWVGLKHFISFFHDPYCFRIIKNTLLIGIYGLAWGFWPPIVLAILLNEVKSNSFKRIIQSISYLPYFISIVVIVGMLMEMLGPTGIVNILRQLFGAETITFFNEPSLFRSLYIGSGIWQGVGFGTIIYMASLAGIDQEQFEAAYIDGANRFQRILHVSLPGIMPVITILLIMNAANIVNVGFEKVYLMYSPLTYETADVISTYVYRRGINNMNFSYGTAIGLINSIVSFIILYITNRASRKMNGTSLW